MRRLARRTLDALTVLSLLMCVATIALWVRSYWCEDNWFLNEAIFGRVYFHSHKGSFGLWPYTSRKSGPGYVSWLTPAFPQPRVVPSVLPALGFALLPIAAACAKLLRKRRDEVVDCCRSCSYDLTGNVSGVCPECGAKIEGTA